MDYPIADLMDRDARCHELLGMLHRGGLICPTCGPADRLRAYRRRRATVPGYPCGGCRRVFARDLTRMTLF
jgi:hypothetical protein